MKILALGLVVLATTLTPPPASLSDPPGIVMGVKHPSRGEPSLMVGILNAGRAYERTATPGQVSACTRWRNMACPACLTQARTKVRPS